MVEGSKKVTKLRTREPLLAKDLMGILIG